MLQMLNPGYYRTTTHVEQLQGKDLPLVSSMAHKECLTQQNIHTDHRCEDPFPLLVQGL